MARTSLLILGLCALLLANSGFCQDSESDSVDLARLRGKSSVAMLRAFSAVVSRGRQSVLRFEHDGEEIALGVLIDSAGLALTKASEVDGAKLTCQLADGRSVAAQVVATDPDSDLALVKIDAKGLKPIQWSHQLTTVGQWVVTPGIGATPEALGIVSVPTRQIPPKRAYMGVQLEAAESPAAISRILPGLGAEKAGLKSGDVILTVNGKAVAGREELMRTLGKYREGQSVTVRVRRESGELEAQVELRVPPEEPGGRRGNRQERMNRLGSELSRRAEGFQKAIQHDTVLQSWQCGGPLLNLEGRAIGLNIARAGRVASYALPTELVDQAIGRLKAQMEMPVSERKEGSPAAASEPHL